MEHVSQTKSSVSSDAALSANHFVKSIQWNAHPPRGLDLAQVKGFEELL